MLTSTVNPPAPIPWIARAAINIAILMLAAANVLPTKNIDAAIKMIGFRPQISESFPQDGIEAALVRRKADPTQV